MTSTLTNQRRVFKACLTQTERVSDDVSRKIGPLDFNFFTYWGKPIGFASELLTAIQEEYSSVAFARKSELNA